jgi:hypothetical protein
MRNTQLLTSNIVPLRDITPLWGSRSDIIPSWDASCAWTLLRSNTLFFVVDSFLKYCSMFLEWYLL